MIGSTAAVVPEKQHEIKTRVPKRRSRSPHPGVILLKPKGTHGWRACFTDPDLGKEQYITFKSEITTAEQRRAWAIKKSKELLRRKMDIDDGAVRVTGRPLKTVFETYQEHHKHFQPRTLYIARVVAAKFISFAAQKGFSTCDKVNRAFLEDFRARLINEEKRRAKVGGKRGEFVGTGEPRGREAINHDLVSIRAMLGYLCGRRVFRLNTDDLRYGLKKLPNPNKKKRIKFLAGPEIVELLEAALDHDAETFTETRAEHLGEGPAGTTPRYPAIAHFIAFVLLIGCRRTEAVVVDWADINFRALDHNGNEAGEVDFERTASQTKPPRTADLAVSPALYRLLRAMHEAAGRPTSGRVFKGMTIASAQTAVKRLKDYYGAPPKFRLKVLRSTCGTFLTNAPGIFGASSAYRSAKQLGHSVAVAENHYVGILRGISPTAKTLEAAMGIEELLEKVAERIEG